MLLPRSGARGRADARNGLQRQDPHRRLAGRHLRGHRRSLLGLYEQGRLRHAGRRHDAAHGLDDLRLDGAPHGRRQLVAGHRMEDVLLVGTAQIHPFGLYLPRPCETPAAGRCDRLGGGPDEERGPVHDRLLLLAADRDLRPDPVLAGAGRCRGEQRGAADRPDAVLHDCRLDRQGADRSGQGAAGLLYQQQQVRPCHVGHVPCRPGPHAALCRQRPRERQSGLCRARKQEGRGAFQHAARPFEMDESRRSMPGADRAGRRQWLQALHRTDGRRQDRSFPVVPEHDVHTLDRRQQGDSFRTPRRV